MHRTACLALTAAALTAAVFACTSSSDVSPPATDGGSDSTAPTPDAGSDSTAPTPDAGSDGGCTGEAISCTGGGVVSCVDGQWVCSELSDSNCSCPAIPTFGCGQNSVCTIRQYCQLDSLPDGGLLLAGDLEGSGCIPLPSNDGGAETCASLLGDAGGCTCTEEAGITITCPAFPCGASGCRVNQDYCELVSLPDGGASSLPPTCATLPSCDGGAQTCGCILASVNGDGSTCSCTVDGMGQPIVICPAL